MVRPANFAFNEETAANNAFQQRDDSLTPDQIRLSAQKEFDSMVAKLSAAGVHVIVAKDSTRPSKPDAVFPNNWISFHQEGYIVTYPIFAPIRRRERRRAVITQVLQSGFTHEGRYQFEVYEKADRFLESTGSIIFDHVHRLAYACLSPRTDADLLQKLCETIGYQPIVFHSVDAKGQDVYHTNVVMALGETFVVICLDTVRDAGERAMLEEKFRSTRKEIVDISLGQMNQFAGNMLQVRNDKDQTLLVMSATARKSLTDRQVAVLEGHTRLFVADIHVIETYGGGSARCMMAEVFLPEDSDI